VEDLIVVGIDPGISGGVCILSKDSYSVYKIPVKKIIKNNKNRKDYDVKKMSSLFFDNIKTKNVSVFQEWTHAMPGNGGVSMYSFGRGHGIWEGIVSCFDFNYQMISPQTWKKMYPEISNIKNKYTDKKQNKIMQKREAISLAKLYMPLLSDSFCKTCDGIAESSLIALYGWNKITGKNHYLMNN
jgi:hypothetical protein